jgi:hypothetical protein
MATPIPERIPRLVWRRPAFVWTPIALALAIGWPAALFHQNQGPRRLALAALLVVFAMALVSLGASWIIGKPPKARRIVVLHVVIAGAIAALAAPFVLTWLLEFLAAGRAGEELSMAASFAMTPLALVIGLPVALISGIVFAWVALERPRHADDTFDEAALRGEARPFN